jgi:hypothetical protein
MRVLETTPPTYSMVKKKHRLRKQDDFNADNSSDEVTMGGTGTAGKLEQSGFIVSKTLLVIVGLLGDQPLS